jgi:hypothetical protein
MFSLSKECCAIDAAIIGHSKKILSSLLEAYLKPYILD